MSNKTQTNLTAQRLIDLPDNTSQSIDASELRSSCTDTLNNIFRNDAIAKSDDTGRILLQQGGYLLRDVVLTRWNDALLGYEFDGNNAAAELDAGSGGYDLTVVGSQPTTATGIITDAREATGTSQFYKLETTDLFNGPEMTILFWYYPTTTSSGQMHLARLAGQSPTPPSYILTVYSTGTDIRANWSGSSGTLADAQTTHAGLNTWSFVAMRYSGTTFSLSVNDGTPVEDTGTSVVWNEGIAWLSLWNTSLFKGECRLDLFRYFDRSLTDAEITEHYNSGSGRAYGT